MWVTATEIRQRVQRLLASPRPWGRGPVCALYDLDRTLFSPMPRTATILRNFLENPLLSEWLLRHRIALMVGLRNALEAGTLPSDLPEAWRAIGGQDAVPDELRRYWRSRFYSDTYLVCDTVIPGAREFVWDMKLAGLSPIYVTGRHERSNKIGTSMVAGTQLQLDWHVFPEGPIYFKPLYERSALPSKQWVMRRHMGDRRDEPIALLLVDDDLEVVNAHVHMLADRDIPGLSVAFGPRRNQTRIKLHPKVLRLERYAETESP